jgi:predicted  nucleic acid-binding Zn-ribbon protein
MKSFLMNSLRFLPALLVVSSLAAQVPSEAQSSNAAPVSYASMSQVNAMLGNLEQTAQNSVADLNKLRVERWKTDGNTKRQEQSDVESLQRNLQNALPGLVNEVRNAPENMAATFKLYHNLDALHDVMRSVAESAGAFGSKNEYQALAADADKLDDVRRSLADRMQSLATSKEAELVRLRTQLQAAMAAPPPPPKKIVVDDTEPPKKATKKKPKKPATTQPAQPAQQQTQQPPPGK